uniref:Uncharacterized protein n=1 Tax=Eutreptiella gymnastica TaxID=73025 RepID=A0A7S4CQ69_9EUGL
MRCVSLRHQGVSVYIIFLSFFPFLVLFFPPPGTCEPAYPLHFFLFFFPFPLFCWRTGLLLGWLSTSEVCRKREQGQGRANLPMVGEKIGRAVHSAVPMLIQPLCAPHFEGGPPTAIPTKEVHVHFRIPAKSATLL